MPTIVISTTVGNYEGFVVRQRTTCNFKRKRQQGLRPGAACAWSQTTGASIDLVQALVECMQFTLYVVEVRPDAPHLVPSFRGDIAIAITRRVCIQFFSKFQEASSMGSQPIFLGPERADLFPHFGVRLRPTQRGRLPKRSLQPVNNLGRERAAGRLGDFLKSVLQLGGQPQIGLHVFGHACDYVATRLQTT